jgi:predicted phosphate transport protein (TIGR00153 family)
MPMRLLPRQEKFHAMFAAFGALIERAAKDLHTDFARGEAGMANVAKEMSLYEHEADTLGMKLFDTLHKSFVTPFDPEDIFALIHHLDDIIDGMEDVAHRAEAYRLSPVPEAMTRLTATLQEAAKGVSAALKALENKGDVIGACIALKSFESEADAITRTEIAKLFAHERDAVALMKQKEIYEYFEKTADACARVATIIGRIHIKGG